MRSNLRRSAWILSAPIRYTSEVGIFARRSTSYQAPLFSLTSKTRQFLPEASRTPFSSSTIDAARSLERVAEGKTRKPKSKPVTRPLHEDTDTETTSEILLDEKTSRSGPIITDQKKDGRHAEEPRGSEVRIDPGSRPLVRKEHWQVQKDALKMKFGEQGWQPRKRLSPDTIEGIRALREQHPDKYTTPVLAEHFKVSAEAIRRILKSKWRPSPEKMEERRTRWARRHDRIWDVQAELGLRPQRTKARRPERSMEDEYVIPLEGSVGP